MKVPQFLRTWFLIHFLVDVFVAIPLFLFPQQTLSLFGWKVIDPIATRLVAAALFGIGGVSLVSRNSEAVVFKPILALKIIWSLFAMLGILLTASTDMLPLFGWAVLAIFVLFASVWIYHYWKWFR